MKNLFLLTLFTCQLSFATTVQIDYNSLPKQVDAPKLPDISLYTQDWVKTKQPKQSAAKIILKSIFKASEFKQFSNRNKGLEWIKRQESYPQVIYIKSGVTVLSDLEKSVGKKFIEQINPRDYLLKVPLIISHGATLIISDDTGVKSLKLSRDSGAFILNSGNLFVRQTSVVGWDVAKNQPAYYQTSKEFRPFITAQGASNTYLTGSHFESLGYNQHKSYGISITEFSPQYKNVKHGNANCWIIDNYFEDIYYGFYSYEAKDTVIVNNEYNKNIVYAIDPHDYSSGLIIAGNETHHTIKRHGIIVSREVVDSWIFNNYSHHNKRHGIVLDRQSRNNTVSFNRVEHNQGDGITIFESPNNLIYGNNVHNNAKHGLRVRNSLDNTSANNIFKDNHQQGIFLYTAVPNGKVRDLVLDPYTEDLSFSSINDQLIANQQGALRGDKLYPLYLQQVKLQAYKQSNKPLFSGAYSHFNSQIIRGLVKQKTSISFIRK